MALRLKCKTLKFLKENMEENLWDLVLGDKFLGMTIEACYRKEKRQLALHQDVKLLHHKNPV